MAIDLKQTTAACPVTFDCTVGLFMPAAEGAAPKDAAVLFLSPWGFEELCTRRFWRVIADELSALGVASLRFDYAGTGDSLDPASMEQGLQLWKNNAFQAAHALRDLSGCQKLIIIGQGLGAALATTLSHEIGNVTGLALLAPVLSGRTYLREVAIWSKVINASLRLNTSDNPSSTLTIASLQLPDEMAADIKRLNIMAIAERPAAEILLLARTDRPQDSDFAAHLQSLGSQVAFKPFAGYDQMVSNVTYAKVPMDAVNDITGWIDSIAGKTGSVSNRPPIVPAARPLAGNGFMETPIRFGTSDRLYGILCEPEGPVAGATVLIAGTAYERGSSWGRMSVTLARDMARSGIPSLRFDSANVGDSPAVPGAPAEILYTDGQLADMREAVDYIEARQMLPTITVGRCSGGYVAFKAAAEDPRLSGFVAVNPFVLYWNPKNNVEELMKFVPQDLTSYGPKLFQAETWLRMIRGEIQVKAALVNLGSKFFRVTLKRFGLWRFVSPEASREEAVIQQSFETLEQRRVECSFIYSEDDMGLRHLSDHFGENGEELRHFSNVDIVVLPDVDHNLTPQSARDIFHASVRKMATSIADKD